MRHDTHLGVRTRPTLDEETPRRLRHHDHELGLQADGRQDPSLVRSGLGQDCMQRHDERLRQLLGERHDVIAVPAAEDAVLVLEQDHVDVEAAQDPGRPEIVTADRLRDRCHEARPLGAGRLVDDHHLLDAVDPVEAEQRAADVRREGADAASPRRVGRDDRGAHGCSRLLP